MFNKILAVIFAVFCAGVVFYLALPNPDFPLPPPDSIQSSEPADLETPLRRGYFTDLSRQEVLSWYGRQFKHSIFRNITLPTLLLNYPPENAQTIIRDQTASTFLQEYAHPFRESLYVNGFAPVDRDGKPILYVDGKLWKQKIIIRYVPSSLWLREAIFAASALMMGVIYKSFYKLLRKKHG